MARTVCSQMLYGKRQEPRIFQAFDRIASEVNTKIRMRGISRGMVCVQEDFNKLVLKAEKLIDRAYREPRVEIRYGILIDVTKVVKDIWVDIRYMLKQHALTVGEIGVLAKYTEDANQQLDDWISSTDLAMSGKVLRLA